MRRHLPRIRNWYRLHPGSEVLFRPPRSVDMDEAAVTDLLASVSDPDLGDDIVSLGLVNDVEVTDGEAKVSLALGTPYAPNESEIADRVRDVFTDTELTPSISARYDRGEDDGDHPLQSVKNIIAVSSGKGGVGKSTVSVNLAGALARRGARVGLFDADIYGPDVPRMVGATERPKATSDEKLIPPERYGIKLMSMAFLVGEDDPVIWRGPMVHKVLTQLWEDVEWGPLDYLVIDLPPGTGDTQLTMLQTIPVSGAVVVTTPQQVAIDDARKGLEMFGKHDTVVLGVVENMRTFSCPDCGSTHDIFGTGGGEELAADADLPFLGAIPLDPAIRSGGDAGQPLVLDEDSETGEALRSFGDTVANQLGIVNRHAVAEHDG